MQKEFARLHVENVGRLSNTECAIRAGYKTESAYQRAHELLNPKICPHVVKHIAERREEFLKKNNVDPQKHLARLNHLALKAEEKEMFGVSLRAEELRGKMAGNYVDKHLTLNKNLNDQTNEDEIEEELRNMLNDNRELIGLKKELKKGDIYGQIKSKNNKT